MDPKLHPISMLAQLDDRARHIFREIVESYLLTGEPIGSRKLSLSKGLGLSPATIRNTMADLSNLGLLSASHISAGRLPTHLGLRLFVDGLLQMGDISTDERKRLAAEILAQGRDPDRLMTQASRLLGGLAGGAGLVLAPQKGQVQSAPIKHVEFVGLDDRQTLVVLVHEDGHVENRLMQRPKGVLPASLTRAGNFLSHRLKGRHLNAARTDILGEIARGEAEIDKMAAGLIEKGLASWSGGRKSRDRRALIVRGQSQLLDNIEAQSDLERIRQLFDELERKEELIELLDQTELADGVKIFIGAENPLFSLSGSSVIVAPYRDAEKNIIGAVGVIGPTRLNYARVIPMVDCTAGIVGQLLHKPIKT